MAGFTDVMKKAFPFISIAAGLGGPLGNMAAGALGKALGVDKPDPGKIPDLIADAMATPEQRLALQKAEQDFQAQMAELGYKDRETMEALAVQDRDSARNREILLRDWYPKLLATVVCVLCFTGEFLYFRHGGPPNASPELIGRILGTLDSALILVLGYYFGSSSGSAAKTDVISKLSEGK